MSQKTKNQSNTTIGEIPIADIPNGQKFSLTIEFSIYGEPMEMVQVLHSVNEALTGFQMSECKIVSATEISPAKS